MPAVPPSLVSPTLQSLRQAPFALDNAAIAWVQQTLSQLSTDQKLRQLFNVALHGEDPADVARIAALGVGGVTRFVGPNFERSWAVARELIDNSTIPLLLSGDIEGGAIAMPFGTPLPNQLGLAATSAAVGAPSGTAHVATGLAEQAVDVLAAEARALGYNWSFTPVLDINATHRSAIVATRSYGSNVDTILAHALVNVKNFQRAGIAATAKHWPGEGFDDRDQHLVTTLNPLSEADWQARFGRLYRSLIASGVMTVMSAHIAWPAYARRHGAQGLEACRPASISRLLNETLLRGELGFNGLIVSDATGMAGLGSWADRATLVPEVIANGCDMLLFPSPFEADFLHLQRALDEGRLTEERVNEAVTRVLGLKAALGLHRKTQDELLAPMEVARSVIRAQKHLAVAQDVARASITLVKDVNGLLPLRLPKHRRVVVVTDPQRGGFAFQEPLPLSLPQGLSEHGFDVRAYDPAHPPTPDDTDLVLYLLAQESLLTQSHIYLDWMRLHGNLRGAMTRHWHALPCLLVSLGHPYYLYDAPRMPCVVNAYSAIEPVQQALLECLLGLQPFTGASPVDATCGLPDAIY
jgi:beta-N-acetylhexosaminidase